VVWPLCEAAQLSAILHIALIGPASSGFLRLMIRSELVLRLAALNPHLYEKDCEAVVNAILDRIGDALAAGDRVEIRGFGAFSVTSTRARQGRNPRTGESVAVSEKKNVASKTGKEMRKRLNPGEPETAEQVVTRLLRAS
jgi:integration host factor subunit beta